LIFIIVLWRLEEKFVGQQRSKLIWSVRTVHVIGSDLFDQISRSFDLKLRSGTLRALMAKEKLTSTFFCISLFFRYFFHHLSSDSNRRTKSIFSSRCLLHMFPITHLEIQSGTIEKKWKKNFSNQLNLPFSFFT
jgi:hypothetical protein